MTPEAKEIFEKAKQIRVEFAEIYGKGVIDVDIAHIHFDAQFFRVNFLDETCEFTTHHNQIEVAKIVDDVKVLALF